MIPIICVVGASNSGKTTFLEKLIPALTKRGYRVGVIKHDAHHFEMDHEGKDTWRHRRAGAQTIAISSPGQVASIRVTDRELGLEELVPRYFWQEDIVITEGYKRSTYPKIEIFRLAIEEKPICEANDNLVALVTDDPVAVDIPTYSFEQVTAVADLIENRFLKERKKHRVMVTLDGKKLPMNNFVEDIFAGGIHGMLSNLRGWRKTHKIDIHISLEDG